MDGKTRGGSLIVLIIILLFAGACLVAMLPQAGASQCPAPLVYEPEPKPTPYPDYFPPAPWWVGIRWTEGTL